MMSGLAVAAEAVKKRKAEAGAVAGPSTLTVVTEAGFTGSAVNKKQGDNLDYRLRAEEALNKTAFKVPKAVADAHPLFKELMETKEAYNSEKPKDAPHPWGHMRLALTLTFMHHLHDEQQKGQAHMEGLFAKLIREMEMHDKLADKALTPTVYGQLDLLTTWGETEKILNDDKSINYQCAAFMGHFEIVETKKTDALLVRFAFLPQHVLAGAWHFICFYLRSIGCEFLDGAAPAGPMFHVGKKDNKKK